MKAASVTEVLDEEYILYSLRAIKVTCVNKARIRMLIQALKTITECCLTLASTLFFLFFVMISLHFQLKALTLH